MRLKKVRLSPSIIASNYTDFNELKKTLNELSELKLEFIHLDVMDGKFVENKTFNHEFVNTVSKESDFILDVHLMVENPEEVITEYIESGADIITIHYEATKNIEKCLKMIRDNNVLAGVSIKPSTSVSKIKRLIENDLVDLVLIMSVEPGECGQEFISDSIKKIEEVRRLSNKIDIEVDGGINENNSKKVIDAGANLIVSGSSFFKAKDKRAWIKSISNK